MAVSRTRIAKKTQRALSLSLSPSRRFPAQAAIPINMPRATRKRKALVEVNAPIDSPNGLGPVASVSQEEYSALIQDMIDNIDRAGAYRLE